MSDASTTTRMTGAEAIVASLEALGVTDVFGMPGGAILPTYDPLMASTAIRHILVRHEQGAGHAAEGYALATGKVGCALVTSGPGATNVLTALGGRTPAQAIEDGIDPREVWRALCADFDVPRDQW